ncbi:MAG TPA: Ig-like domain-containing protein [Clostridia bacterium]|nr:Ig-like domain-containing protein [Clostridia bacterium]
MNKSRIMAVLMAVVIVIASLPGLTVQAAAIGKEAQACQILGILIGEDASGVTSTYLAKTPTRIQAYIISLRLKGLYDEAGEYESDRNFTDASSAGWAKNYLAYAKNNPELGWGGYPDGSFGVAYNINGQAFYKVMLETLGYRQGTDFTYAETLEFAEKKGLVADADEIAKIKSFTVNDIAKGIYSALNTKPAGSDKKLISVMVEDNIISSENAISAGFTLDTKDAKVVAFNAVSNSRIEVEFDQEILLQKADVEITQLGSSSRLSVLSVEADGKQAVITTTEAKPFNAYELAINTLVPTNSMVVRGYKSKYVAMPKDTVKPTAKHELLGRNEILITFDEAMDRSTAESPSNYRIEYDVEVLSAELGDSGKTVLLKTTDMTKFYRLTVQNVCDSAGNSMNKYTATFDGAGSDSKAPSITGVKSENNTTVTVTFNERVAASEAEDTDNYDIDGLTVTAAELDETGKIVTLTTSVQGSETYKLVVSNIEDSWGNTMSRKEFRFVADSTRPSAVVVAISNNEVQVTYTKKMDKESAEDISNYSINSDLDVKEAILDEDGKAVTLITSNQTLRELYTLTIAGVKDAWGNSINTTTGKFGGMAADNRELSYTVKSNGNEIIVTFNKRVDRETAEDVFNYDLDDALGYAAKAELDDTGRLVTLLTAEHTGGKMYSITISNVEDIFGNSISTDDKVATKKFAGIGSSTDKDGKGVLTLETVVTVNVNTVDLVFSGELTEDELDDMEIDINVPDDYDYKLPSSLDYYKFFIGKDRKSVRLQFKTSSSKNPEVFESGNMYEVEVTEIDRLYSKNDANVKLFAGTSNPNEAPEILEVNAINNTAVEVVFSEPVKGITKNQFDIKTGVTISDVSAEDADEITDKVILYISSKTELDDEEYKLYVKSGIKDAAGLNSVEIGSGSSTSYIEFQGTSNENEAPFVDSEISILDSYTIQFEFNEEIKTVTKSSFSVKRASGSGSTSLNVANAKLDDDGKTVTLYLNSKYAGLDSDYEYELTINTSVKDLQDMSVESGSRKIEFDGVDIELEELEIIASYIDSDNRQITFITNRELDISSLDADDFDYSGAGYYRSTSDSVEYDDNTIIIYLRNELDDDETLTIEIPNTTRAKIKDLNNQELSTEEVEIETN